MSKRPHEIPEDDEKEKDKEADEQALLTPEGDKQGSAHKYLKRELANLQAGGGTGARKRTVLEAESPWQLRPLPVAKEPVGKEDSDVLVVPSDEEEAEVVRPPSEPDPTRVIIDKRIVSDLVEKNAICRFCSGELELCFKHTVGVATLPRLTCCSEGCTNHEVSQLPGTGFKPGAGHNFRVVQFAINIQFVLAFLASGDGGAEAARVLGFMNLPNATTMPHNNFAKIEKEMDRKVIDVAHELLHEQVFKEVKEATKDTNFDYTAWEAAVKDPTINLPQEKYAVLDVTMDGAWNQRQAGRSYSSSSGFAILVGVALWMPIAMSCRSTFCRVCARHKAMYADAEEIPEHACEINHQGSAGKMESAGLLTMYHYLYDRYKIVLGKIVTDDDSSMRARVRWSNEDYMYHHDGAKPMVQYERGKKIGQWHVRSNTGLLRYPIPEPQFLADPAHRKKTFRNKLYREKGQSDKTKDNLLHEVDIIRVVRNFAYMTRQLKDRPKEEWSDAGQAVVDHHFDMHDKCGDFCKRKKEIAAGINNERKIYRTMERDKDLYDLMSGILSEYITPDKLEEIGHGYHTNVNESFNNLVAWIAPKNKVYSGSISLLARLSVAIGQKLAGYEVFFRKVFQAIGMEMEPGVWHYLKWAGGEKLKHKEASQTPEYKKKRHEKTNAKIKLFVQQLKEARRENDLYETGIAMEQEEGTVTVPVTESRPKKKPKKNCKCGSTSHTRITHKDCKYNPNNIAARKAKLKAMEAERKAVEASANDEDEQDALDTLDVEDDSDEMMELCQTIHSADKEEDAPTFGKSNDS